MKMTSKLALFPLLFAGCIIGQSCFGGRLIVGKDILVMLTEPLKSVLTARNITMEQLWGPELSKKLGCFDDFSFMSCHATWRLVRNKLYLEEIGPSCGDYDMRPGHIPKVDLKKIFPDQYHHGHVSADWVNGELLAGTGKCIYPAMGYPPVYTRERCFFFINGIVKNFMEFDNSKTKTSPFLEHDILLRDFVCSNVRWNDVIAEIDSTRKVVFCEIAKVSESGKIDSVNIIKGQSELLNREAVRVIKAIPQWEVIFRKGKQVMRSLYVPVVFDIPTMNKYKK